MDFHEYLINEHSKARSKNIGEKGISKDLAKMYFSAIRGFYKENGFPLNVKTPRATNKKGKIMSEQELLRLGHRAMLEMRFEDAVTAFDTLLMQNPSNAFVMYLKGQALSNLGNFQEAINLFDRALQLVGHDSSRIADILIDKGNALLEINDLSAADSCYDKALKIKPKLGQIWVEKARVAFRRNKFQNSIKYCDLAIAINSGDARAWNNKAAALLQLGRLDDCIKCAQEAIALKPDYTAAWYSLGKAYERKGDKQRYRESFEKFQEYGQRGMLFPTIGHVPVAKHEPKENAKKWWQFWK